MAHTHTSKSTRRLICITLLAFLLAAWPGFQPAAAQTQADIKLTARAGFGGYCKTGRWLPVRVTVENSGADVQAQIQIIDTGNTPGEPLASADISLPGTSRKEFFLTLFVQKYLGTLEVHVLAQGRPLAQTNLKITCLGPENILIGLLSDSDTAYDSLNGLRPLKGLARIARIGLADLPDQVTGWSGLDALVIAGVDTNPLSSAQRQAMELWVADGGKLFVVGGANWRAAAAGLGNLLPLELNGTETVSNLSALQRYFHFGSTLTGSTSLAVGTLRPEAYVLVEQDGLPLLVEKAVGFGQVYFFAADPALQPLSRWDGMRAVYEFALTRKSFNVWDTDWNPDAANRALSVLPVLGIPSMLASCVWVLVYLLVIGPANYFFLRRIKRMELAWVSIPALVIIFTLVSYFAGSFSRGSRPIVNRMAVTFSWDGVSQSQVRGLAGVYSPNRAMYTLELPEPFVAATLGDTGQEISTLQTATGLLVPDIAVEIGGMQNLRADGNLPALLLQHDLTYKLTSAGVTLEGTITNNTPYTIEAASLRLPGDVEELGDFAPGQVKNIKSYLRNTYTQLNPIFTNSTYDSYYPANNDDETAYRRQLLNGALYNTRAAENMDWGVYLTGWVRNEAMPVILQKTQFETVDTNLIYIRLNPRLTSQAASVTIPNSFMYRETSLDGNALNNFNDMYMYIPSNGYFLRFWPAIPLQFTSVQTLVLHADIDAPASANLRFALWNYENQGWDKLDSSVNTILRVPQPAPYVGPGGEIRLRLQANGQDSISIKRLDFELAVNK